MDRRRVWYVFRAFNLYRLILAVLLLALFYVEPQNRLLGKTNPPLFMGTTLTYRALVMLSIVGSYQRRPLEYECDAFREVSQYVCDE